jgi:hypothetical protein
MKYPQSQLSVVPSDGIIELHVFEYGEISRKQISQAVTLSYQSPKKLPTGKNVRLPVHLFMVE